MSHLHLPDQKLVDYLKKLPTQKKRLIIKSLAQFAVEHARLEDSLNHRIIAGYTVDGYGWLSDIALGLLANRQVSKLAKKARSLRTGRSTREYQEARKQLEAAYAISNLFISDLNMAVALALDNAAKVTSYNQAAMVVLANAGGDLPRLVLEYSYPVEDALVIEARIRNLSSEMRLVIDRFWEKHMLPGESYYGWSAPMIMEKFNVDAVHSILILDEIIQTKGKAVERLKRAYGYTPQPTQ